jgi:hypothetical protein
MRRIVKPILIYAVSTFAGVFLSCLLHQHATEERGYVAYGGELVPLLLPFFVWLFRSFARDIAALLKEEKK